MTEDSASTTTGTSVERDLIARKVEGKAPTARRHQDQDPTTQAELLENVQQLVAGQAPRPAGESASCCAPAKQASCCAPTEKASCCGAAATSGTCGCQALGQPASEAGAA